MKYQRIWKTPLFNHIPRAWEDIIKFIILSDQQSKIIQLQQTIFNSQGYKSVKSSKSHYISGTGGFLISLKPDKLLSALLLISFDCTYILSFWCSRPDGFPVWEEKDTGGDPPAEPEGAEPRHARPGPGANEAGAAGEEDHRRHKENGQTGTNGEEREGFCLKRESFLTFSWEDF